MEPPSRQERQGKLERRKTNRFVGPTLPGKEGSPTYQKSKGGTSVTIPIRPPFTLETALAKVRAAEDAWNSRDPVRVSLAYAVDSIWRNRDQFIRGRSQIQEFLTGKWQRE